MIPCPHVAFDMRYDREKKKWEFHCTVCLKVLDSLLLTKTGHSKVVG